MTARLRSGTLQLVAVIFAAGTLRAQGGLAPVPPAPAPAVSGDAERGRAIVEGKGGCLQCHAVKGRGSQAGPDLTDIAIRIGGSGAGRRGGGAGAVGGAAQGAAGARESAPAAAVAARQALETSLLDPDAEVLPQNRTVRAVTKDGAAITGRLLNHDTFSVQLIDATEHLVSLNKADLREYDVLKTSAMPSYRDKLSGQELEDVIAYLLRLKGTDTR
jgi:mono/diheme cytochrome c family protein